MFSKQDQIQGYDDALLAAMNAEEQRQEDHIELIASENYTSKRVMEAQGSGLTNKYAEGYPGKRYYGGCEHVDKVEVLAIERAKQLFGADYANVQPHSGSSANSAVYLALLNAGDTILGMSRKQPRQNQRDQRQSSINNRLLLPSPGNQQTQRQGRQYVQRVGVVDEHPVRHLTDHTEQQQPAQIAPLPRHRRVLDPMQIRRDRQAKPRERQAPRHIQPVQAQTDIPQVVQHHTQQRQPLEQVQGAIADAAYRNAFRTVHNSPMTLH